MKRLFAILAAAPLFAAGVIPGRYIVELSTEPVAVHAARAGRAAQIDAHRAAVRAQQAAVRSIVESSRGKVRGAIENLDNALFVEISADGAAQLAAIPGVRAVYPERLFRMTLDRAVALLHAPEAWTQAGISHAGAGIKIGMIDSGIDISHPGFQDGGFTAPTGFPRADNAADMAFTNNKVIVARSYANLFAATDPDPSARDRVGHGTATAMCAAGVNNAGPMATISGMAPQAYLGSYKVFGSPGINDSASESALLQALEDAAGDGMDVVNMSLTTDYSEILAFDPLVTAVENAASLGVIVVVSAGNYGPDPQTIGSPADAPHVISVGATNNDRTFSATAAVQGGSTYPATPASGSSSSTAISAPLVDVSTLDGNGLACGALPANSLAGSIAFIERGTCYFEVKLDNAQAAGAVGALLYDNVAGEDPIIMAVGAATLPAEMLTNADGLALEQQIAGGLTVALQFALQPMYTDPARLANFSSQGPNIDFGIKPDLVAVGQNLYTAAQSFDPTGELYSASGYGVTQGTSFSAPLVAGAAALLKQARPGLAADQYRSLLIDTAGPAFLVPGTPATFSQAGAGLLNALNALNATAAATPVSLSFGTSDTPAPARSLTVFNAGSAADRFQISAVARSSGAPVPVLGASSLSLDAGASAAVSVTFTPGPVAAGAYEGYIEIQGAKASVPTRVPYWYAAPSGEPAHVTILDSAANSGPWAAGARISNAVLFRITDSSGLAVTNVLPQISVLSGGGRVTGLSAESSVPNSFTFSVRLGTAPGSNVFQIQAGPVQATVTIVGQ